MATHNWTLDQLKKQLSENKAVKAWIITQENVRRRERYFMLDGTALVTDQDRDVQTQNISVKVIVHLPRPGRQGETTQKFFTTLPLKSQLDAAVGSALQTDHQAWDLPTEIPGKLPQLATTDPRIAEDIDHAMGEMTSKIEEFVAHKRPTTFNSAELFLSIHDRALHLSNGLIHRSSQSRAYAEAAFSMIKKAADGTVHSDEYLNTRWAVNLNDLSLEDLFQETTDRAEHSMNVSKPETGKYPVIIDAEVLSTLLNGHIAQLSAANAYHGLPFVKPGEDLIPQAKGDLMTLTLDPLLDFGADTAAVSEQGILQSALKLVDRNIVKATLTDKQYADYLGKPASSSRGNVVLAAGSVTHSSLCKSAPQVLEVLQFSGLFADPNSGTFSSEIRLAKLYDNEKKTVTYVKGGSLSGSITENFSAARFSNNLVKRAQFSANSMIGHGYYGPEFALLNDVSIVG